MSKQNPHGLRDLAHLLPAGFDALFMEGVQIPAGLVNKIALLFR